MNNVFNGIFNGKRVFLTGHTGFKGAWLSIWLKELGADVCGYSLEPPTSPSLFEASELEANLNQHIIGDVRDSIKLNRAIQDFKPDFVFHLAAQSLVRKSYKEPHETYETNVIGTLNLLEAALNCDTVKVCQVITSDKCYENKEWIYAYRENDPLGGHDPYSSSKACQELVVTSYRESFFANKINKSLSSVRAGNVIGGGDWAEDRIIPDCIRALIKEQKLEVRNPSAIRPWQHVLEPLSGYLMLASKQWENYENTYSQAWNIGPFGVSHYSVQEIVNIIFNKWGAGQLEDVSNNSHPHEATYLKLDITKISNILGWFPILNINESINKTIDWYKTYYNKQESSIYHYTQSQILEYVKKAKELNAPWASKNNI